ncbi:MAG: S9 family peptidase [Gammaproteobacteria bacterium]|nr:S9 family peptidase [Gammaproteobacteria bacterium]
MRVHKYFPGVGKKQNYLNNILVLITMFFLLNMYSYASSWQPENALRIKTIESIALSVKGDETVFVVSKIVREITTKKLVWTSALYYRDVKGKTKILSAKQQNIASPAWSPKAALIAYLAKGAEHQAIWIINPKTQVNYKLIELNRDIASLQWAGNGKSIAFVTNSLARFDNTKHAIDVAKDYVNAQLYVIDVRGYSCESKTARVLTPANISILFAKDFNWSSDSKTIVYAYQERRAIPYPVKTKLALVDVGSGKICNFNLPVDQNIYHPVFSPNGKWIAFGSNLFSNKKQATAFALDANVNSRICLLNSKGKISFLANTYNTNPMPIGWNSTSDKVLVYDAYKTNGPQIYSIDIAGNSSTKKISNINGYLDPATFALSHDGKVLAFTLETGQKPAEIFRTSINDFHPLQISQIQPSPHIVKSTIKVISWKSSNKTIEGILNLPPDYTPHKKYPLLVAVHGGPIENWSVRYLGGNWHNGKKQLPFCLEDFLDRGFVVLQPNPSCSSGYGLAMRREVEVGFARADYQDIMQGVTYLEQQGIVDAKREAIFGWSYGGYLAAWIITQTHKFKAAVIGAGYTNLISYMGTTDIPELLVEFLGKPYWLDAHNYNQLSPLFFAKNITSRVLIVHGDADQRIPIAQGYEFFTELNALHKTVKMLRLPSEGHLPEDPNLILSTMAQIEVWLRV